ncbi:MAG: hypothetical protein UT50_C0015G0005 [Candidatus Moranbacteria bacterium GW2011_GWA2_39_41]|nr:MAG: hypothetical protein UT50_C0015G0005 [Candidatus Moranbacteria bacterium GW2011_GWA2_39_41]
MFEQPPVIKSTSRKIFEKTVVAASLVAAMGGEMPKDAFAGDSKDGAKIEDARKKGDAEDFFNLNRNIAGRPSASFVVNPDAMPGKSIENPKAAKKVIVGNENPQSSVEVDPNNFSVRDTNGNVQTRHIGVVE